MTSAQEERLILAFESIAATMVAEYAKKYPTRDRPADIEITRVLTEEDRVREDQGDTDEPLDRWTTLGTREEKFQRKEG